MESLGVLSNTKYFDGSRPRPNPEGFRVRVDVAL